MSELQDLLTTAKMLFELDLQMSSNRVDELEAEWSRYQYESQELSTENKQLRELNQLLINFQLSQAKQNFRQLRQFQENYFDTNNAANSKRENTREKINNLSAVSHKSTITTLTSKSASNRNRSEGIYMMDLKSNEHQTMEGNLNSNLNASIDGELRDGNDKDNNDDDIEKADMSSYTIAIDSLQTENIKLQKNNEKLTSKMETEQSELLKLGNENSELRDSLGDNKLYIEALSNDLRLQRENHRLMDENVNLKEMNDKNSQNTSSPEENGKKDLLFGGSYLCSFYADSSPTLSLGCTLLHGEQQYQL